MFGCSKIILYLCKRNKRLSTTKRIYTTKWICLVRCVVALSGHFRFYSYGT